MPVNILLVDDDPDDRSFFEEALRDMKSVKYILKTVRTGREVIGCLEKGEEPDVIVLDLNMPLLDGFQVLQWMRSYGFENPIPVFVLSTSDKLADQEKCLSLGAHGFYSKPSSIKGFTEIAQEIVTRALQQKGL
jgi:CheY-like chemotaxis protein